MPDARGGLDLPRESDPVAERRGSPARRSTGSRRDPAAASRTGIRWCSPSWAARWSSPASCCRCCASRWTSTTSMPRATARRRTGGGIEWRVEPPRSVRGRAVLVLDDILDGGETLARSATGCSSSGAASFHCAVLAEKILQKEKPIARRFRRTADPRPLRVRLRHGREGLWRNLPAICAMKEGLRRDAGDHRRQRAVAARQPGRRRSARWCARPTASPPARSPSAASAAASGLPRAPRRRPYHRAAPGQLPRQPLGAARTRARARSCRSPRSAASARTSGPGTLVVPDQIIDYTWGRPSHLLRRARRRSTHIDFTEPYSAALRARILAAATGLRRNGRRAAASMRRRRARGSRPRRRSTGWSATAPTWSA